MSLAAEPHYLLFCESNGSAMKSGSEDIGKWRFLLEPLTDGRRFEVADEEPVETGNRLELVAVVRGLEALDQPSKVTLLTSSQYVAHGFRHGLSEWRRSNWQWERFGRRQLIRNHDLWQRIDGAMQFHHLECRNWHFGAPEKTTKSPFREGPDKVSLAPDRSEPRFKSRLGVQLKRLLRLGNRA